MLTSRRSANSLEFVTCLKAPSNKTGAVFAVTRRFLPTLVVAIVGTLAGAMLLGEGAITLGIVVALFALTGVKRALDEPRMREIEASTGWDRAAGGTT